MAVGDRTVQPLSLSVWLVFFHYPKKKLTGCPRQRDVLPGHFMKTKHILLLLVAVCSLAPSCNAFGFEVSAKARQCFFEYAEQNALVGVMFQVTHGGFLDINVQVCTSL